MNIVIDLQGAQSASRFRGIGRYSLSLTSAIIKNQRNHNIIVVLSGVLTESHSELFSELSKVLPKRNIRIWDGLDNVSYENFERNKSRIDINEYLRESFIHSLEPDFILLTSVVEGYIDDTVISINKFKEIPTGVVFYDAIPLIQPEKYLTPEGEKFKKYYFSRIENFKKADLLFSISESSSQEAISYLNVEKEKVVNIFAAVDDMFCINNYDEEYTKNIKAKFSIKNKFLLYTGATDERKNHNRLIKAYSLLSPAIRKEYQLVIAGGMPDEHYNSFKRTIKNSGLGKGDVVFTHRVSDEYFIALYNLCDLYIFPSWHEGFGLPVLEAMKCGAPVIGSEVSSIPEVIDNKAALFNPFDEKSIANKITEVLENDNFKKDLKEHSKSQSKKFNWNKSAEKVLDSIEDYMNKIKINRSSNINYQNQLVDIVKEKKDFFSEIDLLKLSQYIVNNHMLKGKKNQLLLDISELVKVDAKSGIQRVVKSVLNVLISKEIADYEVRAVYACMDRVGYKYANKFMSKYIEKYEGLEDDYIDINYGDIFYGLDFCPDIQVFHQEYYKKLNKKGVKTFFNLNDLLLYTNPEWWSDNLDDQLNTKKWFEKWLVTISDSTGVISISNATKNEFQKWMNSYYGRKTPEVQLYVSHIGADIVGSLSSKGMPQNADYFLKKLNKSISFLMVGTIEPRKGHLQSIKAFEALWNHGYDVTLIIVGKKGWMVEELCNYISTHQELDNKLFWLNGISDEYLNQIYKSCSCLLYPSEGEGFGLPLIEAAQYKIPIIARDILVFREVAGDNAFYFKDSKEIQVLYEYLIEWISLYEKGEYPQSENIKWLTWEKSSMNLLRYIGVLR